MGIGISIFLIAAGAILTFGLDVAVRGLDLSTIGVILMIVGGLGIIVDLLIFGRRDGGSGATSTYVHESGTVRPANDVVEVRRYDSRP